MTQAEAFKPIADNIELVMKCGYCGRAIGLIHELWGDVVLMADPVDYCPHCGRKVEWDE